MITVIPTQLYRLTSPSEESKQKMSEVRVGIIFSEEHKRNISKVKTGLSASEETRKKMSESQKRRRENEPVVVRQKFSETMKRVRAGGKVCHGS